MDRSHNRNSIYYKLNFCIYPIIILLLTASGRAQQAPSNTNIAGPSASATGNVTNQAVQVLQGPYAVNTYGNGVSCQGATFSVSPFLLRGGNENDDPETFPSRNQNWGISAGINIPLDGGLMELCKERAQTEITRQKAETDKSRLDFELVRLLKCGEAIKSGISFHTSSPYYKVCADIVVKYPQPINISLPAQQNDGKVSK
jgi:hypothetical protein